MILVSSMGSCYGIIGKSPNLPLVISIAKQGSLGWLYLTGCCNDQIKQNI